MKRPVTQLVLVITLWSTPAFAQAQQPLPAPDARQITRPAPAPSVPTERAARPVRERPAAAAPAVPATLTPTAAAGSSTMLLPRVDEGVFDLQQGKSVDLTDRKVLLHFRADQRFDDRGSGRKVIWVAIAGRLDAVDVGQRIDLKAEEGTMKMLVDKDECFLDVVGHVAPQGAPQVATFRLFCL